MIRVAQPADPLEAQHLLGVLEEHGIRACVQGESLWAARGELPFGPESAPSLWVNDEADAERARQILADHKSAPQPAYCPRCGTDLRELDDSRCPTCDTPLRGADSWTCPNCGEVVETQFTNCWSCGSERGDATTTPSRDAWRPIEAPEPICILCDGTGQIEHWFTPTILLASGLFLGFAALRNAFEQGTFQIDSVLTRALYAVVAVLCLYFARRVRRTACPCRND